MAFIKRDCFQDFFKAACKDLESAGDIKSQVDAKHYRRIEDELWHLLQKRRHDQDQAEAADYGEVEGDHRG